MHIECGDEQNCDMAVSANAVAVTMESNAKLCHAVTMTTVTVDDDANGNGNDNIRNMLNNLTGQIYSAIDCIAFHKHVYCSFRYKHKANLMPFNSFFCPSIFAHVLQLCLPSILVLLFAEHELVCHLSFADSLNKGIEKCMQLQLQLESRSQRHCVAWMIRQPA